MGPGVWLGFVWVLASNLNGGESPLAEESASQLVRGCLLANFEPELLSKGKGKCSTLLEYTMYRCNMYIYHIQIYVYTDIFIQ